MSGAQSESDSEQPLLGNINAEQIEVKVECPDDFGDEENPYADEGEYHQDADQHRSNITDLFAISNYNSYYEEPDPRPPTYRNLDLDPPQRLLYTRDYSGQYDGWNRTSTRHLIALYRRYRDRIGSQEIKSKKQMWDIISKSLAKEHKLKFTAAHCENRWRVLERNYRKIIASQRNGRPNRTFEFFDDLNSIFRKHKDRKPMAPPLQPKIPSTEPPPLIQSPSCTLVRTAPNPLTFLRLVPNNQTNIPQQPNYPLLITSVNETKTESPKAMVNGVEKPKFVRRRKRNILSLIRRDLRKCGIQKLRVEKQKLAVKEKKLALMQEANQIMMERNEILKDFVSKISGGMNVLNGLVAADLV